MESGYKEVAPDGSANTPTQAATAGRQGALAPGLSPSSQGLLPTSVGGQVIPPGCDFSRTGPLGTLALSPGAPAPVAPSGSHQASWSGWSAGS